jgi:class 3 adenylate cyclase/tetratricopeptide (TPR) repeat protein
MNCGASLAIACPNCGAELPAQAKFCSNCGHQIAASESTPPRSTAGDRLQQYIPHELRAKLDAAQTSRSMEGERRIVTMLFCDVKGSTSMAEKLDPEEWVEIMNQVFEYMIEPVYRYEGTIARLMGDAILAFFGAPIAHEDDPQRAVLAGLDILEGIRPFLERMQVERGLDFNVRVGINTGLVVVGEVGSDLRVEYTAMGDAVNLAARMEQTAQPGTVQVSVNTYKLVAPLFDFEPLGSVEVKGKSEPILTYRPLRLKARPGSLRGIEGLHSPLVGRDREFEMLKTRIEELQQGHGSIVSVIGEAGLGKSRLMAEVRQSVMSQQQPAPSESTMPIIWYEGRSLSYQTSTPYTPFVHLFNDLFHLHPEETDAQQYARITAQIEALSPARTLEIAPFIGALLGIELTGDDADRVTYLQPPQLREMIFQAVASLVELLAYEQPLVLVFEDLHWTDSISLELLERILPFTNRTRLMIIALFRPQRQEPSWQFHQVAARDYAHRYSSIALEPLDEHNARTLVANLLEIEDLPEKVRGLILKKAEGNPFFVEEVIRSLLDAKLVVRENSHWRATRDIENITVPDTLAGVITARLDRLDSDSKRAAQTASVVGREFQMDIVADVFGAHQSLEQALGNLQQRELVREKSRLPQAVYLFKHALTQETAYASILLSKRRELHRQVAECLERNEPQRVNEIAWHFIEAQETKRALPYLVEAADRAAHAYSTPEAIGFYTQALEILNTVDDLKLAQRAYEGLGSALVLANDVHRAVETYDAMIALAEKHGDFSMQISGLNKLAYVVALRLGQFPEAEERLVNAENLARHYNDRRGLAEMFNVRCMMCTTTADFEGVVRYMSESVQIARELNVKEQLAHGLDHIAGTLTYMTRFDEAWQTAQEGLQLARELGNRECEAGFLVMAVPFYHLRNGNLESAWQTAQEGTNIAASIGSIFNHIFGVYMLGEIARLRGEYERALECHQQGLQVARALQDLMPFMTVIPMAALGTTHIEISETFADRATQLHTEALPLLEQPSGMPGGGTAWADIGFCALAVGNSQLAAQLFEKGLTLPTIQGLQYRVRFLVGSAMIALTHEQFDEAIQLVSKARSFAEERAIKYLYPLIHLTEAQIRAARGEQETALDHFARAEETGLPMQLRPVVWQARAGAAAVLAALGRTSEAEAQQVAARDMVDEIAGRFTDPLLRGQFVESALGKIRGMTEH